MSKVTRLTPEGVIRYLSENPKASFVEIGNHFNLSRQAVFSFFKRHPKIKYFRLEGHCFKRHNKIMERGLMEIADVGDDLSRDIAIRTLESRD